MRRSYILIRASTRQAEAESWPRAQRQWFIRPQEFAISALNSASVPESLKNRSINQSTLEESTRSRRTKHKSHGFHIWLNKCFEQCHEGHRGDISSYGPLVTEQRRGPSRRKSDGSRSRVPLEVPGGLSGGTDERLFCPS